VARPATATRPKRAALKTRPAALFSSSSLPSTLPELEVEPSVSSLACSLLAVQVKTPSILPSPPWLRGAAFFSSSQDFSMLAVLETSKAPLTLSISGKSTLLVWC
jgi:hypothetical protein